VWRHLVSIEERRISALVIGFLTTLVYCMVMYAIHKTLDPAWVSILQAIIAGVVGAGGVDALKQWAVVKENLKNGKNESDGGVESGV